MNDIAEFLIIELPLKCDAAAWAQKDYLIRIADPLFVATDPFNVHFFKNDSATWVQTAFCAHKAAQIAHRAAAYATQQAMSVAHFL